MASTTKLAFNRVLLSPDLLASISRFQDGIYLDMLPFLHVHVPRRHHVDRGRHISSLKHNRIMADDFHPVISTWLDAWSMGRLLKMFDCLPFLRDTVLEYAAWSGNVVLLDWFWTTRRHDILPWLSLIGIAVERNQLHILERLSAWGFRDVIFEYVMHAAIHSGNLRVIRHLHEAWDVPDGCAMDLMAHALRIRDADIVMYYLDHVSIGLPNVALETWLVSNAARAGLHTLTRALLDRGFDGSNLSIDMAASGGSLQLVQYLHDLGTYKCTTAAMNDASARGDIEMATWLHTNRDEGCTTSAMDNASRGGHLDMVRWLYANQDKGCTTSAFFWALERGDVDIAAFVHSKYPDALNPGALGCCAENALNPGALVRVAENAMRAGHAHVVQFLHELQLYEWSAKLVHLPSLDRRIQTPLDAIAASGNIQAAQWMHDNQAILGFDSTCTTMDMAAENGHLGMLHWLHHHHPTVGCTVSAVQRTIEYGRVDILDFLVEHGCVDGVKTALGVRNREENLRNFISSPELTGYIKYAASSGHGKMIRWLLALISNDCACDLLRQLEQDGQDGLVNHILRKKIKYNLLY
ncbi:Aste57867_1838 [Aphanomyces stellatus]|uniref:Aste57867_1838 protein n=1 Tax=Aphanomyces stellatus TaxID=120398 RepID=A0A485KAF4_9STRA|nr:hypothetical protein As57867_001836 [Aphanomyces stellatus]VFT79046.1 Aste57867_1838 [Aphanomyces stellatus]